MEVFVTSPWVPVELIKAHGLQPRGAWSGVKDRFLAVPEGACAIAQGMVGHAAAHPDAAIVFTTACDQMRRAADAVGTRPGARAFLFNLPATWQSSAARRLYHDEIARFGKFLVSIGGQAPSAGHLEAVIREHEARRSTLREFIRFGPVRQVAQALAGFYSGDAAPRLQPGQPGAMDRRVPLAVVGGPLLASQWTLFDTIEASGGTVVVNATEPGERCLLPPMPDPAPNQDLLAVLADHYFDYAVDGFHRPNSRLYAWLGPRLTERRVRGLVLWVHVNCDLWRAEAASLHEAFGLPVLALDAHEAGAGSQRDINRLGAFMESLL